MIKILISLIERLIGGLVVMYKFRIEKGKYIAYNAKDENERYEIPFEVYRTITKNNKQKTNDIVFSDSHFKKILDNNPSIISLNNPFNNIKSVSDAKKVKEALEKREEAFKILRDKKKNGKQVKVNRKKSKLGEKKNDKQAKEKSNLPKKIIIKLAPWALSFIAAVSAVKLAEKLSSKDSDNTVTIEKTIDSNDYIYNNNLPSKNKKDVPDENINDDSNEEDIINEEDNLQDEKDEGILEFYYERYENASEESAKNAMQYIDLCKKYGKMYGEDYRILAATLAQELNGIHAVELDTPAVGVSQLEKEVWVNTYISAYNVEYKNVDGMWMISPNTEDTINNEEFNKRTKSGDIIEEHGEDKVINIEDVEGNIWARAMIDANYREQAYINGATEKISDSDFVPYTKARENKGPIVWKTLEYGDEWKYHLDVTNNGDDNYVNEVFTYADMISDYCDDHSPYVTIVYDSKNDKTVTFTLNAVPEREMARTK